MKKLLTLLLTLVMAICLVNINVNNVEAEDPETGSGIIMKWAHPQGKEEGWYLFTYDNNEQEVLYNNPNGRLSVTTEKGPGAGPKKGKDNKAILTLGDDSGNGFNYTSNNKAWTTLTLMPHGSEDKVRIVVKGDSTLTNTYNDAAGHSLYGINIIADSDNAAFTEVVFEGKEKKGPGATGNYKFNIVVPGTAYAGWGSLGKERYTFKNIDMSITTGEIEPVPTNITAVNAFDISKASSMNLVNSNVTFKAGTTYSDFSNPTNPTIRIGFGLFNTTDMQLHIDNNSKLTLDGSISSAQLARALNLYTDYKMTNSNASGYVTNWFFDSKFKFGEFDSFGTYAYYATLLGSDAEVELPCFKTVIEGADIKPTPMEKDGKNQKHKVDPNKIEEPQATIDAPYNGAVVVQVVKGKEREKLEKDKDYKIDSSEAGRFKITLTADYIERQIQEGTEGNQQIEAVVPDSETAPTKTDVYNLIIEFPVTPKPSPSEPVVKDESCEKVIGPTWHWNESKGICEDVGVVGTATR